MSSTSSDAADAAAGTSQGPGQADAPEPADEQARLRRLFRVMSLFVLWPAATTMLALLAARGSDHAHGPGFVAYFVLATALGAAGYFAAPWLARKAHPERHK